MRAYALPRPDGGVTVLSLVDDPNVTIHGEIDKLLEAHPEMYGTPDPEDPETLLVSYYPLESLPPNRDFRDAWAVANDGHVMVDMPKAQEIHKNRWRQVRSVKLAALDVEYMRALEAGDQKKVADIAAKKQALRDVTKTDLSKIESPEMLSQEWPDILK